MIEVLAHASGCGFSGFATLYCTFFTPMTVARQAVGGFEKFAGFADVPSAARWRFTPAAAGSYSFLGRGTRPVVFFFLPRRLPRRWLPDNAERFGGASPD